MPDWDSDMLAIHAGEQAKAGKDAANATKTAADTARDALKDQQKTFEINQRPYVIPSRISFTNGYEFAPQKPLLATLSISNIGKTPAEGITGWGQLFLYGGNDQVAGRTHTKPMIDGHFKEVLERESRVEQEATSFGLESDIAPGQPWLTTSPQHLTLTMPQFDAVKSGDWVIYYLGVIRYGDSLKRNSYETEVCYFYIGIPPGHWNICDDHNRIK